LGECLQWLQSIEENDRAEIQKVLADIIRGQALDLQRFGGQQAGVRALKTASELEEYTYLVAGCVGGVGNGRGWPVPWPGFTFRFLGGLRGRRPDETGRLNGGGVCAIVSALRVQ